MDLGRQRDVHAYVRVLKLRVHERVDAHPADTGLETPRRNRNSVTDAQLGLLVVRGTNPRGLKQVVVGPHQERGDLEVRQARRPTPNAANAGNVDPLLRIGTSGAGPE